MANPSQTSGPSQSQSNNSKTSETSAQQPSLTVPLAASTSSTISPQGPSSQPQSVPYGPYSMSYTPGGWQNPWQVPSYPFIASGSVPSQQAHYTQVPYGQYQPHTVSYQPRQRHKVAQKPRSPTPEPEFYCHWDEVIRSFLKKVGLNQALRGFEDDMVVMNAAWERQKIPGAIGDLMKDLMVCTTSLCRVMRPDVFLLRIWGKSKKAKHPKNDHWRSESSTISTFLAVLSPNLRRQ